MFELIKSRIKQRNRWHLVYELNGTTRGLPELTNLVSDPVEKYVAHDSDLCIAEIENGTPEYAIGRFYKDSFGESGFILDSVSDVFPLDRITRWKWFRV